MKLFLVFLLIISVRSDTDISKIKFSSFSKFSGELLDIFWCGMDSNFQSILALTSNGEVFRSSSKGFSWDKLEFYVGDETQPSKVVFS